MYENVMTVEVIKRHLYYKGEKAIMVALHMQL
jgi:hypothetical protein